MSKDSYVLTLSCPNQRGIVAAVAAHLFDCGGDILEAHQFDDVERRRFFMRVVYDFPDADGSARFDTGMAPLADRYQMVWASRSRGGARKVVVLASKTDHCLADLLYRWRTGELPMDLVAIASNHPRSSFAHLDFADAPFHHLPISPAAKAEQEATLLALIEDVGAELVVLARYMQILSPDFADKLAGRCINIHHSFLPGFVGAKPYHQAHARGVKLIGATAHFVTADLDQGPIIEQDVERISHHDTPADLIRKGRDIERRVLARAVGLFLDDRILLNGPKSVVFRD